MQQHIGEIAALASAMCFTVNGIIFEIASKRIGALSLNLFRLVFAFLFLGIFSLITRGMFLPLDAGTHQWIWLPVSGIIGLMIGDYFLFRAFAIIGSRVSMLIMTLVPPITALISFFLLNEVLTPIEFAGMALVLGGIALAVVSRGGKRLSLNYNMKGLFFAIIGATGQAVGFVLSKYGMEQYDPFAATHIRILTAAIGFLLMALVLGKTKKIHAALRDKKGMTGTVIGSFFGPFLGISLSLFAVQRSTAGVTATLMSIVPILIIIPSFLVFKQKVTVKEVIGAVIAVAGVFLIMNQ
ncbi:MAG: DMT family transporter [Bacteroidales bacterium]|nr:DMT family transporter [Bacteroidales bacterium]